MIINGCYNFNKNYLLIDITLPTTPDGIDWFGFSVPEDGVDEFDRIVPHMEQYLTEDGCDKLCDAWDEPEEQYEPTRVAFFIRKSSSTVLETPYGNIDMSNPAKLSETLKQIIEFEKE